MGKQVQIISVHVDLRKTKKTNKLGKLKVLGKRLYQLNLVWGKAGNHILRRFILLSIEYGHGKYMKNFKVDYSTPFASGGLKFDHLSLWPDRLNAEHLNVSEILLIHT